MALSPELQRFRRRLLIPLGILTVTHVLGTLGFWWDWKDQGGTVSDALFMTFMTVTTIGYGIQYELSAAGRLVTMLVAGAGIGSLFFSFGVAMEFVVSEGLTGVRRRNRMQRAIDELQGHFILAGMGRATSPSTSATWWWAWAAPRRAGRWRTSRCRSRRGPRCSRCCARARTC